MNQIKTFSILDQATLILAFFIWSFDDVGLHFSMHQKLEIKGDIICICNSSIYCIGINTIFYDQSNEHDHDVGLLRQLMPNKIDQQKQQYWYKALGQNEITKG